MNDEFQWPEVFVTKNLNGKPDAELCAIGLLAWGNCMAGRKPCENFGKVICEIAHKLGILGTPKSFMEISKRYTSKQPVAAFA